MKKKRLNVLITGSAGNLGSLLAKHLQSHPGVNLRLLIHRTGLDPRLAEDPRIRVFRADLADQATLDPALKTADVVIHFAGVLFKNRPEKFLPVTNVLYFRNLLEASLRNGVRRLILVSFPHVEGETDPAHPAMGRLDGSPRSVHAATRLQEEKMLFAARRRKFEPVSLRVGMVYGRGILMIDAARWLSKHRLLAVWNRPTWIHLVSKDDFLTAAGNALTKPGISGIFHLGDEGVQTLQEFLDALAVRWGFPKPWRLPLPLIYAAAILCEFFSLIFNTKAPLTRDFIRIGTASYYGDTSRMRKELVQKLKYPDFRRGLEIL